MLTITIQKELITNAFSTNKQLSHYARDAIIATCGRAAGIIGK